MSKTQAIYDQITKKIIEDLEEGIIPWRRDYNNTTTEPKNYFAKHAYRGINRLLLPGGEYLSKKQLLGLNGTLKPGATPYTVVFYTMFEKPSTDKLGEKEKNFVLRTYDVYHLKDINGIDSRIENKNNNPIEDAEAIVNGYPEGPIISHKDPKAPYYTATYDTINIPSIKRYETVEKYYSALFRMLVHSTGHEKRLNRFGEIKDVRDFEEYSKETLIGEFGATMLCSRVGLENESINITPEYIEEWIKLFKKDSRVALQAACKAQSAVDKILGVKETK